MSQTQLEILQENLFSVIKSCRHAGISDGYILMMFMRMIEFLCGSRENLTAFFDQWLSTVGPYEAHQNHDMMWRVQCDFVRNSFEMMFSDLRNAGPVATGHERPIPVLMSKKGDA